MIYRYWPKADVATLKKLSKTVPAKKIGRRLKIKRSESAVRQKAQILEIPLTGGRLAA